MPGSPGVDQMPVLRPTTNLADFVALTNTDLAL
jgi:hypothetical protein